MVFFLTGKRHNVTTALTHNERFRVFPRIQFVSKQLNAYPNVIKFQLYVLTIIDLVSILKSWVYVGTLEDLLGICKAETTLGFCF